MNVKDLITNEKEKLNKKDLYDRIYNKVKELPVDTSLTRAISQAYLECIEVFELDTSLEETISYIIKLKQDLEKKTNFNEINTFQNHAFTRKREMVKKKNS